MSADWGVARDGGRGIVVGWALLAALVRAVIVVVSDEVVEYHDGISVGAFRSHGAHRPLGVAVCSRSSRRGLHGVDAL
jgi:hypothetical protein